MYYYVDTGEVIRAPKKGVQYTAWYNRSTKNNPGGYEHVDIINGKEVCIRATTEDALMVWLKRAYQRAPYIKIKQITESKGDE